METQANLRFMSNSNNSHCPQLHYSFTQTNTNYHEMITLNQNTLSQICTRKLNAGTITSSNTLLRLGVSIYVVLQTAQQIYTGLYQLPFLTGQLSQTGNNCYAAASVRFRPGFSLPVQSCSHQVAIVII